MRALSKGGLGGGRAHRSTTGFALLELVIAMIIGGMAVAAAAAMFLGLQDRADTIRAGAEQADRDANAERLLRGLFGNLDPGEGAAPPLVGGSTEAALTTWCDGPRGWLERCIARIYFTPAGRRTVLRVELRRGGGADTVELRRAADGSLLYLLDPARGGTWTRDWSRRTPPIAMALVWDRDTLLLARAGP